MHDDRDLVEQRIRRELWERVLPLVHRDRRRLAAEAGPDPDHLDPVLPGAAWGPPWGTTWFRFRGEVPPAWAGARVEAVIDLGFDRSPAGFQCEGLVVAEGPDGRHIPLHGIHPNRRHSPVKSVPGPVDVLVEAASNPSFPEFRPSQLGSRATAGAASLYRFGGAQLVVIDPEAEALVHDLDVLDGIMRSLPLTEPRRARLLHLLAGALDAVPDTAQARALLRAELADAGTARRHRIIAVGHAHIDTAWLWPMQETERKCARTFASAVALTDDDASYRFACSSAQQYAWIERNHPDLFAAIGDRVARGQWIPVGGMWVEADMNLPSGESLARQIVHGQRYFERHFGHRCTEVWIPDVFGYPPGLPQLFAAGGMRRFVTQKLSWNKQNRFPHHTFWWEGLDGTRVLTHFPPVDTYNAEVTPQEAADSVERFREHRWSSVSLMPFGYGDGGGGPIREMLDRAHRLARADARWTLEIGTPAAFFEAVEDEVSRGADVPVWRGELYFEMHRGTLTSQLRTKIGNRRCERLLVEAELWAATAGRAAEVDDLWREVLTQQFHDILPGSSIAQVHDDAEAVFARVEDALEARITDSLRSIAPPGTWLANAADVPLDGVVVIAADAFDEHAGVDGAVAGDVGAARASGRVRSEERIGPIQRLSDGCVAFHASVPAFGLAAATPGAVGDAVTVSPGSIANRHLAVRWDALGELTSIFAVDFDREVIPHGRRAASLELARDQPVQYDAWDLEAWVRRAAVPLRSPAEIEVLDSGPLVGRVRVTRRFGPSAAVVVYELQAGARELVVHVHLDWQHDEHLLSIAFPVDVRAETAACDVQFGLAHRPTHPSSPWDAAKFEVCAHRFVDLAEPSFGVAILNDGRYGHCLFDGAVRVSLARAAKYPDPGADHGTHDVTLAVRPHGPGRSAVRAAATLLNRALRVVGGGIGPELPPPVVDVSGAVGGPETRVEVDAVKMADDGSGDLIVRLHEACGDRVPVSVRIPHPIEAAWRCDLLEVAGPPEEVSDGIATIVLSPFELVTLRLRHDRNTPHTSIS